MDISYRRKVSNIGYYLKSKHIQAVCKYRIALLAVGGREERIHIYSNHQEHMGSFSGHKGSIFSLSTPPNNNSWLASGSYDKDIKIWDLRTNKLICTLSGHSKCVRAICYITPKVLVSGSWDQSLIVWEWRAGGNTYNIRYILTGHLSDIHGIIRVSKEEVISGEHQGDLRIWNIREGVCIKYIPRACRSLWQMKCLEGGYRTPNSVKVGACSCKGISVWGTQNNWEHFYKQFTIYSYKPYSFELLQGNILLRGGYYGDLGFEHYLTHTEIALYPPINLHSRTIWDILSIAKNIVATISLDGTLKLSDPFARICYVTFQHKGSVNALVKLN